VLFVSPFVWQELLDEQLSAKLGLYLASFGTDVQPLWASETPRIVNHALYVRIQITFYFYLFFVFDQEDILEISVVI